MENNYKNIDLRDAELRVAHEFIVNINYYYEFINKAISCFFKGITSSTTSLEEKLNIAQRNLNNFLFSFFIKGDIPYEMKKDIVEQIEKEKQKFILDEVNKIFENAKNNKGDINE